MLSRCAASFFVFLSGALFAQLQPHPTNIPTPAYSRIDSDPFKSPIMRRLWEAKHYHHVARKRLPDRSPSIFQTTPPLYSVSPTPYDVALGDFNSDGKQDAIASSDPPMLLLGNGDGTFQASVAIGTIASQPYGVAVGDFNRDGQLDVAFATGSGAVVYLGKGDGTFGAGTTFTYGNTNQNYPLLVVADVNRDGNLDLIVNTDVGISALLGNGNGTFKAPIVSPGSFSVMAAGDFNRDGVVDLAAIGSNGLSILLGNGLGSFTTVSTYGDGGFFNNIAVGDLNHDGLLDVALPNGLEFLGNGDGTFQAPKGFPVVSQGRAVAAADVNGDGIPDLVSSNTGQQCGVSDYGNLGVSIGNGDGTFQPLTLYDSGTCDGNPTFMAVGDLNNDGAPDLIVMDSSPSGFVAFVNKGKGTFPAAILTSTDTSGFVAVDDFNRDGNADVLFSDGNVFLGNGDGTLRFYGTAPLSGAAIVAGDFNQDGKPDVAQAVECVPAGCASGGALAVALGNGDGGFQTPAEIPSGGFYSEFPTVADFDNDGNSDIALVNGCTDVGCSAGGSISVFLGNGNGAFALATTMTNVSANPLEVVAGDFNNDGLADLAAVYANPNGGFDEPGILNVFLGNGDGSFQAPIVFYTENDHPVAALISADLNGDGILDLAIAFGGTCSDCPGGAGIMYGNGDGTFSGRDGGPEGSSTSIVAADFFGIGNPTPIVSNPCGDELDCPGGSLISLGPPVEAEIMLAYLATGDFNNDGKPDLIGSLRLDPGFSILLNTGAPVAATTTTISPTAPQTLFDAQPITFTARVQHTGPQVLTGSVDFLDSGSVIGSGPIGSNGFATLTTSSLATGSHFVVALYQGDSNFASSNSLGVHVTVSKATSTTTLVSSVNPSLQGKTVTFTATVSSSTGTPTGTVQFLNGTAVLGSANLNSATAKYSTYLLPVGSNSITAVYSGDSNNTASTSAPLIQTVLEPTSTILTASPNPSSYGQAILLTATVSSSMGAPPNGETVTFKQGANILGTGTLTNGVATLTTPATGIGSVSGTAVYNGDANFAGSLSEVVYEFIGEASSSLALTSSQNPSAYGQPVTFTATVTPQFSGTPTGIVVFSNGTSSVHMPLVGGTASYTTSKLPRGTDTVTATYNGNADFTGSANALVQTIE